MKSQAVAFFLFFVYHTIEISTCLEAIQVGKLPRPTEQLSPYYDGDDSIYLFGGLFSPLELNNYDIYKYTISTNTLATIGVIPPTGLIRNNYILVIPPVNSTDYLYYLVPLENNAKTYVFKLNLLDGSSTEITTLPLSLVISAWTRDPNSEDVLIFSGSRIYKLNLENEENIQYEIVARMSQSIGRLTLARIDNTAFIFGDYYQDEVPPQYPHITVNLETLESSPPATILPDIWFRHSVTTNNAGEIYLIGGIDPLLNPDYGRGLLRINGSTQAYDMVPVENIPLSDAAHFNSAPAMVYVEKLNRLYFFGGLEYDMFLFPLLDHIWYVELDE